MEDKRDIFDGKFGDFKEERKEELSFSKGAGNITEGIYHIFRGFKHILFKKFPFNLLLLLLVLGLAIAGTYYLKPTPTGMVIYQNITQNITQECPACVCEEKVCPVCPECQECPECKPRILKMCPDGQVADENSECKVVVPTITSKYKKEVNGITLSIDGVEYEDLKIKTINYTIINQGFEEIKPQLSIKVYEQWSTDVNDAPPDKVIKFSDTIGVGNWAIRSDTVSIDFEANEKKIRLELEDALITPPEDITSVVMEFR